MNVKIASCHIDMLSEVIFRKHGESKLTWYLNHSGIQERQERAEEVKSEEKVRLSGLMEVATSNASLVREEPAQTNWKYTVDALLVVFLSW